MKRRKLIENGLAAALSGPGFNEGKGKPFSAEDIRFTQRGKDLYVTTKGTPSGEVLIKTLAGKTISEVGLLGTMSQSNGK